MRIRKVVVFSPTNPTKLVLHFYDFSMIFYTIYKKQPNHFTIGVNLLQGGPRKEIFFCNVAPGRSTSGGPAKFRPTAGRGRPGTGGGESKGCCGPILGVGWGQGGVRRGAAPAARPGGRRGLCAGEVGSMQGAWGG
jgi:hypothetical protein